MSRTRTWPVAFLAISLLLSACGSDVATPSPVPAGAPTAATGGAAPTATTGSAAAAPTAATGGGSPGTLNGVTLPADAAPADQQVRIHYDNTADFTTLDFCESVYKRGAAVTDCPLRLPGAPRQELQGPTRRRHQVGGRLHRPGLDVPPRPEPDVVGRHPRDRRRLRRHAPLWRRSQARLGLHLVLPAA